MFALGLAIGLIAGVVIAFALVGVLAWIALHDKSPFGDDEDDTFTGFASLPTLIPHAEETA